MSQRINQLKPIRLFTKKSIAWKRAYFSSQELKYYFKHNKLNGIEDRKPSHFFYVADFDLESDPANLLAIVYNLKKCRDENPDKPIFVKPFGLRRTMLVLLAYQTIFPEEMTVRRFGKDVAVRKGLVGLTVKEKNAFIW